MIDGNLLQRIKFEKYSSFDKWKVDYKFTYLSISESSSEIFVHFIKCDDEAEDSELLQKLNKTIQLEYESKKLIIEEL